MGGAVQSNPRCGVIYFHYSLDYFFSGGVTDVRGETDYKIHPSATPLSRQQDKANGNGRVLKTQIPDSLNRTPFLGRVYFDFLCVEHIIYKIQLHSNFILPPHGRETQPSLVLIQSAHHRALESTPARISPASFPHYSRSPTFVPYMHFTSS